MTGNNHPLSVAWTKPDALAHFERAKELSPGDASAALNVGVALIRLARDREAEHALRASAALFPDNGAIAEAAALASRLRAEGESEAPGAR